MEKRKYLSRELRGRIINKCNSSCFYCGKKGRMDERMMRVVETKKIKKIINGYDDIFVLDDKAFHFDHHVPLFMGGGCSFANLVLACERCNLGRPKTRRNYAMAQI